MALLVHYKVGKTLGEGSFGIVKHVEHLRTGQRYAAKIVSGEDGDMLRSEILCHRSLSHEHIVKLHEAIEVPNASETTLLLELVEGPLLLDHLADKGRLSEQEARRLFQQLVAAVAHCHERGIAHRDLKLDNILLDGHLNVKLMDFGLATLISVDEPLTEACGSPHYAAPELQRRKVEYQGDAVDVWALGVILYTLVCGELPFDDDDSGSIYSKVRFGRYQAPEGVSAELAELVKQMLTVNAKRRISISAIQAHPWLCSADEAMEAESPELSFQADPVTPPAWSLCDPA